MLKVPCDEAKHTWKRGEALLPPQHHKDVTETPHKTKHENRQAYMQQPGYELVPGICPHTQVNTQFLILALEGMGYRSAFRATGESAAPPTEHTILELKY